jgi:hypothetical protein
VLSTDTETPIVTETTMDANLLQALKIVTQLGVERVREDLQELAVLDVLLSVEEPVRDAIMTRMHQDVDDLLELLLCHLTSTVSGKRKRMRPRVQ